jgi:ribonuclease PH
MGSTRVLCCATLDRHLPGWLKGQGKGWVTAEYGMLPKTSSERIKRDRKSLSGRTQEIQRLIGRSLRAGVDLIKLGEWQIIIDCDVIEADGGTRTASITAGYVALSILLKDMLDSGELSENPVLTNICAISAGIVNGVPVIDLDYNEDSDAQVDINIVMNTDLELVEIQGTAEGKTFKKQELDRLIELAETVIPGMITVQNKVIADYSGI